MFNKKTRVLLARYATRADLLARAMILFMNLVAFTC